MKVSSKHILPAVPLKLEPINLLALLSRIMHLHHFSVFHNMLPSPTYLLPHPPHYQLFRNLMTGDNMSRDCLFVQCLTLSRSNSFLPLFPPLYQLTTSTGGPVSTSSLVFRSQFHPECYQMFHVLLR